MPSLNVITIDGRRSNFQIKKKGTTIGRSNDNNLILSDEAVSRHHAKIIKTNKGYILTDLGSVNHTMVNGEKIRSVVLRHSDRIKIGRSASNSL